LTGLFSSPPCQKMDARVPPEFLLQRPPDSYLTCQQCGITFVWTGWEQQHAQKPTHCPGCRHLQALTHSWGVVKWFDGRKGFGIIRALDGAEHFVRRRDVKRRRNLRKNQVVRFKTRDDKDGQRTVAVHVTHLNDLTP